MELKQIRKDMGISQLDLAYHTKISRFRLFMAEKGYQKLTDEEKKCIQDFARKFKAVSKKGVKNDL